MNMISKALLTKKNVISNKYFVGYSKIGTIFFFLRKDSRLVGRGLKIDNPNFSSATVARDM